MVSVWAGAPGAAPWFVRDPDLTHPAASTLKLPLAVAVLRADASGLLSVDDEVPVHDDFVSAVAGAGFRSTRDYDNDDEPWARLHDTASLGWLVERSLVRSSNLATNLLLERVGVDAVRQVWSDVAATGTTFSTGIQDLPARASGLVNETTAADLAAVLSALVGGTLLDPARTARLREVLADVEHADGLPAGVPAGTRVEHKPGWIEGACHDAGLVVPEDEPPFVLSVMTSADLDDAPAHRLVADVARACWDHRPGR